MCDEHGLPFFVLQMNKLQLQAMDGDAVGDQVQQIRQSAVSERQHAFEIIGIIVGHASSSVCECVCCFVFYLYLFQGRFIIFVW